MKIDRPLLRDAALLLLAVLTVAAAGYVLTRSPETAQGERLAAPAQPLSTPERTVQRVRALFVGGDLLAEASPDGLAAATASALGWDASVNAAPGTGYLTGPAGQAFPDRVAAAARGSGADVVVLVSSAADAAGTDGLRFGGSVQAAVGAVRTALPDAQVVLVGPIAAAPDAAPLQREVLTQVAARFGAVFVDPTGRGYLEGRPDLVRADGTLEPAGVQEVARRLAADLRRVLPSTLVPSAAPAP